MRAPTLLTGATTCRFIPARLFSTGRARLSPDFESGIVCEKMRNPGITRYRAHRLSVPSHRGPAGTVRTGSSRGNYERTCQMKKLMAVFLGFSIAVLGCTSASSPPKPKPPTPAPSAPTPPEDKPKPPEDKPKPPEDKPKPPG